MWSCECVRGWLGGCTEYIGVCKFVWGWGYHRATKLLNEVSFDCSRLCICV